MTDFTGSFTTVSSNVILSNGDYPSFLDLTTGAVAAPLPSKLLGDFTLVGSRVVGQYGTKLSAVPLPPL